MRGWGRSADHKRLAAEDERLINAVSTDCAFLDEQDQTAKPILVLRERRGRWTEALLAPCKGGADPWVVRGFVRCIAV